jgi:dolichyl-phosphate beta-glucosyltransferase
MSATLVAQDRHITSGNRTSENCIVVPPSDHDLTVIIPAYNEEKRLPWTLAKLTDFLAVWNVDFRVIVVDDGSADRTANLADHLGPRFSTLRLDRQSGKGRAVRTAMLKATGRVAAFTDADLPFDLRSLRDGYDRINSRECEIVFGARDLEESEFLAPRHISRQIATRMFRELAKLLISRQITDTQCGLKIFSRQAALEIFSRATIDGFAFDAEVVMLTEQLGLTFRRIPVTLVNDYGSTLSLRRNALPMLLDVLRLRWNFHKGNRPPEPHFQWEGWEGFQQQTQRKKIAA